MSIGEAEDFGVAQSRCPVCYAPLGVRDVTPCFICGGWPESVARFNSAAEVRECRLPDSRVIVMCRACELEEFMVPGGWGYQLTPGERLPVNLLQSVRVVAQPQVGRILLLLQPPACIPRDARGESI